MKTLESFKCVIQYMVDKGVWDHRELTVRAFSEEGAHLQMDHVARQMPGGSVLIYNLKELELFSKRVNTQIGLQRH